MAGCRASRSATEFAARAACRSDFDVKQHRLQPLKVEAFCGMMFGTFADEIGPVENYLGRRHGAIRQAQSRPAARVLGTHSQIIHNNWKLYAENLRDSYHATLLHTFYTTFKVNRLDMDGGITLSDRKVASHQFRAPREHDGGRGIQPIEGAFRQLRIPRWRGPDCSTPGTSSTTGSRTASRPSSRTCASSSR